MKYAQIKDGIVEAVIILENENAIETMTEGFDFLKSVEGLTNQDGNPDEPGRYWLYNDETNIYTDPDDPNHTIQGT